MTLDRFTLMLAYLTGRPIPQPPAIPGTVFKAPNDDDDEQAPPAASPGRMFPRREPLTRSELQRLTEPPIQSDSQPALIAQIPKENT